MVKHPVSAPLSSTPPVLAVGIKILLCALFIGGVLSGGLAWLIPIEVIQSWVLERTTGDDFRKFEAVGRAEAGCWLIRFIGPFVAIVSLVMLRRIEAVTKFLINVVQGWLNVTNLGSVSWRTSVLRGFCVMWGILALSHFGYATVDCLTNWPYYRFKSGADVLPNISDSNRLVIRYLMNTTEPNARIFIASDQKLYFLSYYLLPRRLYYQSHPDSEFVIPQPNLQRPMAAYSLAEIDPKTIERISPDYVLEYFEQPDLIDRSRLSEDRSWVAFYRQHSPDPNSAPPFLVSLRRFKEGRGQ